MLCDFIIKMLHDILKKGLAFSFAWGPENYIAGPLGRRPTSPQGTDSTLHVGP